MTKPPEIGEIVEQGVTLTPRIKAFGVNQALFHGTIIVALLVAGGAFSDHLARSWLLITVFSLNPKLIRPFWLSVLLFTPYIASVLGFYAWFAYGYLGLEGNDPIHMGYLIGVLVFLFGVAVCSNWIAIKIFRVNPSHIFNGSLD